MINYLKLRKKIYHKIMKTSTVASQRKSYLRQKETILHRKAKRNRTEKIHSDQHTLKKYTRKIFRRQRFQLSRTHSQTGNAEGERRRVEEIDKEEEAPRNKKTWTEATSPENTRVLTR